MKCRHDSVAFPCEDCVEPGCQGRHCTEGDCDMCRAVPTAAWLKWKKTRVLSPTSKRPPPSTDGAPGGTREGGERP